MAVTNVRGRQLKDDDVLRQDLNTTVSGSAVIRKVIAGTNISISSTGVDAGTGDVTINSSYTETDTLATVTGRGATTATQVTLNGGFISTTGSFSGAVTTSSYINFSGTTAISTSDFLYKVGSSLYWKRNRLRSYIERTITGVSTAPADYNKYYEIGSFAFSSLEGVFEIDLTFNGSGYGQGSRHIVPVSYAMDYLTQYSTGLTAINGAGVWLVLDAVSQTPRHLMANVANWELQMNVNNNTVQFRIVIKGGTAGTAIAYVKISHNNDFDNCTYTELTGTGVDATTYSRLPSIASGINGTTLIQNNLDVIGDVAIGLITPLAKLHVSKDSGAATVRLLQLDNSNATYSQNVYLDMNISKDVLWGQGSAGGGTFWNAGTRGYGWSINGTSIVNYDQNGNVGIGFPTPNYKLEVNGTGRFVNTINSTNGGALFTGTIPTNWLYPSEVNAGSRYAIVGQGNSNAATFPTINSFGSVGVVGVTAGSTGGRANIGVFGYTYFTQNMSTNSGNTGYGGYFLAEGRGSVTDFIGNYVGIYAKASIGADTGTGGTITAANLVATGNAQQTTYGALISATGGGANYGVHVTGALNYFSGNVGIGVSGPIARLQLGSSWVANPGGGNQVYLSSTGFANSAIIPELLVTSDTGNTTPGGSIGLALHNTNTTAGAFAPLLVFSKREIGASNYNASIAAIGARTVTGTGASDSWIDGELIFYTSPTSGSGLVERARIDQAGNLGVGVIPSAWVSTGKAIQIGTQVSLSDLLGDLHLTDNAFWNGSNWIYLTTGTASNYYQSLGAHFWRTAISGTAGTTASFTQGMTLSTAGNLSVTGTVTGSSIIRSGGTASQFLKADGTVDPTTYLTASNSLFVGTTSISLGRASAAQTLTGVSIDGNAATATTLQTARTINGVSFNGSANIAVGTLYDINYKRIVNPGGAEYNPGSNSVTGAIAITLPVGFINSMIKMVVSVYNYNTGTSFDVYVGGYVYSVGPAWVNCYAYIVGQPGTDLRYNIRFSSNGTNPMIYIGETNSTWSYPQVYVTEVQVGHGNQSVTWTSGWSITAATTFNTILTTIGSTQVGYATTTNTAGAAVLRDASGNFTAGTITATSFVRSGGTASQFLKADGTVDGSTYLTTNQTITLSGAVTGSGTTAITTTLANSVVGIANLSATGTASASTYLRGDNTWASIPSANSTTRYDQSFVATAGQTVITVNNALAAGYFDVYINGVKANSDSFTFSGTTITLVDGLAAGDIVDVINYVTVSQVGTAYGTSYSMTSGAGTGTAVFDTIERTGPAVYEVVFKGNPNGAGSGSYLDFVYGKLVIGTGWNGSTVAQFIQFIQESPMPRTMYGSGGGNLTVNAVFLASGVEYNNLTAGSTYTVRFKVSGYNTAYTGASSNIYLKQIG